MLKVGDVAPDFSLQDKDGKTVKLSSFKGKKNVVVFFYPADSTPGCTVEVRCWPLFILDEMPGSASSNHVHARTRHARLRRKRPSLRRSRPSCWACRAGAPRTRKSL